MIRPYYKDDSIEIYNQDCLEGMRGLAGDSVDLLATDPPYGIGFMGQDFDKALPDKRIWAECLRVLKPGAFAFVMSIPRADCLSRMIISLEDAGFLVNFTPIFWAMASGFPKAQNISLAIDKQECRRQLTENLGRKPTKEEFDEAWGKFREVVCKQKDISIDGARREPNRHQTIPEIADRIGHKYGYKQKAWDTDITNASSPQAKALDGSYGGFQPKPAVEVIIVAMKPLSEKTFVDQALKNRKGITWLDDGRMPYEKEEKVVPFQYKHSPEGYGYRDRPRGGYGGMKIGMGKPEEHQEYDGERECNPQGRFPANLLVSDDVLNDGRITKSGKDAIRRQEGMFVEHHLGGVGNLQVYHPDSGSFSRYFDLDKWWEKKLESMPESARRTFPFLVVPKASKGEKNRGLSGEANPIPYSEYRENFDTTKSYVSEYPDGKPRPMNKAINNHPTVKPVKLMAYLITLGSRPGDTVLDNFAGTGTTGLAAKVLGRKCVMFESDEGTCQIAAARLKSMGQRVML